MSDHAISSTVAAILAILGLAVIALLVSNAATTGSVFATTGASLANVIRCALSPVTGGSCGGLGASVSSTFNTGCVTVGGQSYCP
jgi:hypothetical protein